MPYYNLIILRQIKDYIICSMDTIFKESLDVISFIVKNKKIEKIKLDDSIKPYGYSREYKSFDYEYYFLKPTNALRVFAKSLEEFHAF